MKFSRVGLPVWVTALALAQQGIAPDELAVRAAAYVPPSQFSLRTESRLVEVGVVVRQANGHTVGGLTREDFEVEDGGKKREIGSFRADVTPPPAHGGAKAGGAGQAVQASPAQAASKPQARFLALVFDDLSMGPGDLIPARMAAKKFLSEGISAGDVAAVFFLSRGQVLPFTADTEKLGAAVDKLTVEQRNAVLPTCPNLTAYESYLLANQQDPTLLQVKVVEAAQCGLCERRDRSCPISVEALAGNVWRQTRLMSQSTLASLKSIVEFMAKLPGKRVVLMASSGFLSGTLEAEREEVINRALQGDVVINSLDAKGLFTQDSGVASPAMNVRSAIARQSQGTRPQTESNDTMAILAASTGGLFFHNSNDLETGFRELGLEPEFSYSIAFTPGTPDNKYHNLKVRLKQNRHYNLQARPGYFAAVIPATPPPTERTIDRVLMGSDNREEVPATIAVNPAKMPTGEAALQLVLHLDVPHLPFANLFGVRSEKLTVIAALFDGAGTFVTGKECEVNFNLKDETFRKMAGGMSAALTLAAPAGKYRLRGVIQEGNGGKITASSRDVVIE